jgi:hypothetical protein
MSLTYWSRQVDYGNYHFKMGLNGISFGKTYIKSKILRESQVTANYDKRVEKQFTKCTLLIMSVYI